MEPHLLASPLGPRRAMSLEFERFDSGTARAARETIASVRSESSFWATGRGPSGPTSPHVCFDKNYALRWLAGVFTTKGLN